MVQCLIDINIDLYPLLKKYLASKEYLTSMATNFLYFTFFFDFYILELFQVWIVTF